VLEQDDRYSAGLGFDGYSTPAAVFDGNRVDQEADKRPPVARVPKRYGNGRIVASERIMGLRESQIFSFAPDGGDRKALTSSGYNVMPSWSRDGRRILFSSNRGGGESIEIWGMDADGGNQRQPTFNTPGVNFTPVESPDATRIAFTARRGNEPPEVCVMNADGSRQTQLTHGLGDRYPDANVPCWSFDGTLITFWAGKEAQYGNVWVMKPDGTNPRRVTDSEGRQNSDDPHWSPDGTKIVFGRGRGGNRAMSVLEPGTGEVTAFATGVHWCDWQPLPSHSSP